MYAKKLYDRTDFVFLDHSSKDRLKQQHPLAFFKKDNSLRRNIFQTYFLNDVWNIQGDKCWTFIKKKQHIESIPQVHTQAKTNA